MWAHMRPRRRQAVALELGVTVDPYLRQQDPPGAEQRHDELCAGQAREPVDAGATLDPIVRKLDTAGILPRAFGVLRRGRERPSRSAAPASRLTSSWAAS